MQTVRRNVITPLESDAKSTESLETVLPVNPENSVASPLKATLSILLVSLVWLLATYVGWIGYSSSDSLVYASYAYHFHELPHHFWEFRMPAILAIRASFLVFGPTEFAACVPTLLASLAIMGAVAWFVEWPRNTDWKAQGSMLIAATLPHTATLQSVPMPSFMAAGMQALATVIVLKGKGLTRLLGAALLAIAFLTYELSFFYVAIFCLTAVAVDAKRHWKPVIACVAISAGLALAECAMYQWLLGDPIARWHAAAGEVAPGADLNIRFGGSQFLFYIWPLQILFFQKAWAFAPGILLISGVLAWRRLSPDQRILLVIAFVFWLWLGYGTQVPWAYRPRSRSMHYYVPLALSIAALLPYTVSLTLLTRKLLAQLTIGFVIACNVGLLAVEDKWSQPANISRDLLQYSRQEPSKQFLTDLCTLNEMFVLNGFVSPPNVFHLGQLHNLTHGSPGVRADEENGESHDNLGAKQMMFRDIRKWLRKPVPQIKFEEIDAILLNLQQRTDQPQWPSFAEYVEEHGGQRVRISQASDRLLFVPLRRFIGHRDWMVKRRGGDLVWLSKTSE